MLHTKFQASKPSYSEEEDIRIFFYVFLSFEPKTHGAGPSWPWDLHLIKRGKGLLGSATYRISGIQASDSEKKF